MTARQRKVINALSRLVPEISWTQAQAQVEVAQPVLLPFWAALAARIQKEKMRLAQRYMTQSPIWDASREGSLVAQKIRREWQQLT
jgi:hypothetical protein